MDINGVSAIVTGGASGIGAASVRQLAARGARVVIADLQADRGAELAENIGGAFVSVDVTHTEQIEAAVNKATELGPLRVLGMTPPLARDLSAVGIRVNTIAPGLIDTPSTVKAKTRRRSRRGWASPCYSRTAWAVPTSWLRWSSNWSRTPT
jgi:NAD(P)-dependent dehydrogenase (short-subunit alcohol dehydrogenase family)